MVFYEKNSFYVKSNDRYLGKTLTTDELNMVGIKLYWVDDRVDAVAFAEKEKAEEHLAIVAGFGRNVEVASEAFKPRN